MLLLLLLLLLLRGMHGLRCFLIYLHGTATTAHATDACIDVCPLVCVCTCRGEAKTDQLSRAVRIKLEDLVDEVSVGDR
jgi:hypothetical protein